MYKIDPKGITEHINKKWNQKGCPRCSGEMSICEDVYELRPYQDGAVYLGERIAKVVPIMCMDCDYIEFIKIK